MKTNNYTEKILKTEMKRLRQQFAHDNITYAKIIMVKHKKQDVLSV